MSGASPSEHLSESLPRRDVSRDFSLGRDGSVQQEVTHNTCSRHKASTLGPGPSPPPAFLRARAGGGRRSFRRE